MRISERPSGPFRRQLFFTPSEIDEVCVDALAAANCLPSDPRAVDVERFIEKHFRCEMGYDDLPDGVLGFTAFQKTGKVVTMRVHRSLEDGSKNGERRVRSTWAHEAGHGLLHASLFIETPGEQTFFPSANSNVAGDRILCRNDDIKAVGTKYDGRWWEWQANRCIGGLLLPKSLVVAGLNSMLSRSSVTNTPSLPEESRSKAIETVSELFNVSLTVARIRLEEVFPAVRNVQFEF